MKFILLSLGVILLIWYLAPLFVNKFNVGNLVGITLSSLLILFAITFDKLNTGFRNFVLISISLVLAFIVIPLSFNMIRYANYKSNDGANTVIVLGCKVNGTQPSQYLYDRCEKASEYLKSNKNAVAVLSGGQGSDEDISEAQCMENVLVEMGIDRDRLYKEDESTNTAENIKFSKEVIEKNDLSENVLVVTNEFHEYRAKLLCDEENLNFHSKCSYSSIYSFLTFYTREILGLIMVKLTTILS